MEIIDSYKSLDKYVGNILSSYKHITRRNYYKMEENSDKTSKFLNFDGYGEKYGLVYLVDLNKDIYMDIHIYKNNKLKLRLRINDDDLIDVDVDNQHKTYLNAFISLANEYILTLDRFAQFNIGRIPVDLIRNNKINKILYNE